MDAEHGVLLDVVGSGRSGEDGDLRGMAIGLLFLELVQGFLQTADDLVGVCQDQQYIGLGVALPGEGGGIGQDDAAGLGDEVVTIGDAHQSIVRFPLRCGTVVQSVFPKQVLHGGAGSPQGLPTVLGRQLPHAVAKLGFALQIDEDAAHVLELLDEGDGIAVFLLDGFPSVGLQVDVLEHRLRLFDDGVSHLGENLLFLGGPFVRSSIVLHGFPWLVRCCWPPGDWCLGPRGVFQRYAPSLLRR